ncbi:MAG: hypothetical protein OEM02_07615 [Desulfobulbaceae bacterium]|nr:hypothetical protein [Desulfobulbaceae bacterium]
MKWRHTSGFNVDNSVCIGRDDEVGITNLVQYIIRSPFFTSKISYYDANGMVVYYITYHHPLTPIENSRQDQVPKSGSVLDVRSPFRVKGDRRIRTVSSAFGIIGPVSICLRVPTGKRILSQL